MLQRFYRDSIRAFWGLLKGVVRILSVLFFRAYGIYIELVMLFLRVRVCASGILSPTPETFP